MNNVENAKAIFNIAQWSEGYFDVNEHGSVIANPARAEGFHGIDLSSLVDDCKELGVKLPVLVRFTDILQDRVDNLVSAFRKAKEARSYTGVYTAVYPIKVNQQYSVIRKLLNHHSGKVGLEAGSKPELMAILGVSNRPITIVCNGYKDREFLRIACLGQLMGHQVTVVVEKLSELDMLLDVAEEAGVFPFIGVRIRLNSVGKGKWQNTGGEKGKFGLSVSQVLQTTARLKQRNQLDKLNLVHFHIGSQVANIRDIHQAINECARYYAELYQMGLNIKTVDVGGGLGVDYEGSGSRSACSMNYTVDEYARNVVAGFADVCQAEGLPHPDIITESGRALTAHHAVLITDVIDVEYAPGNGDMQEPEANAPAVLRGLWEAWIATNPRRALETYHDAAHYFGDAHMQFVHGVLDITQWSRVEQMYFAVLQKIRRSLDPGVRAHREILDELNEKLADKLFVNFSLFQSLPDVWGIDQLFPILPLTGLNKPLTERVVIQDITCDSDGQIRQYADGAGIESTLPLPRYQPGDDYLIGMFMIGAYQEILGDLHNLFGDTDSIHVELTKDSYNITNVIKGDAVSDVLRTVHINPEELLVSYQKQLMKLDINDEQRKAYLAELREGLAGYTYFEG